MEELISKMYEHNRWANLTLLDACENLTTEQLESLDDEGFYGSIGETLNHLVSAEGRYVWRLQGSPPDAEPPREDGFPGVKELRRRAEKSGTTLIELAVSAPGDTTLTSKMGEREFSFKADLVKIQAINHATEHRAQIATLLTQLKITPPQMDGWNFGFASGLMKENDSVQNS